MHDRSRTRPGRDKEGSADASQVAPPAHTRHRRPDRYTLDKGATMQAPAQSSRRVSPRSSSEPPPRARGSSPPSRGTLPAPRSGLRLRARLISGLRLRRSARSGDGDRLSCRLRLSTTSSRASGAAVSRIGTAGASPSTGSTRGAAPLQTKNRMHGNTTARKTQRTRRHQ